ncbi:MAG: BrnT family toxin [Deltaproteobacteria bacterium]|nr:BrnT family toxin [Deltaproteobacteria bacterium]
MELSFLLITGFQWDAANVGHIQRHGVRPDEVEELLGSGGAAVYRAKGGRYVAYGRTLVGRHLFVVFEGRAGGRVRVITARDQTDRERRTMRRKR